MSLLVQGGTMVTKSTGVSVGGAHVFGGGPNIGMVGVTSNTSVGQSALAQMLAPPAEPKPPTNTSGCAVFAMAFFGAMLTLGSLIGLNDPKPSEAGAAIGPLIIGLGLCGGAFFVWRSGAQEYQRRLGFYHTALPAWRHAMENWNQLFCCNRCGCVFEPHSRRMARPQEMQTLIFP